MSKDRQWIFLSLLLLSIGGLIIAYKVIFLGFPLLPDLDSDVWTVQVRLEIAPEDGPVKASLLLPSRPSGYVISKENYISRRFGLTVDEDMFRRQADWAIRRLSEPVTLYYRATIIPDTRTRRFAPRPGIPEPPQLDQPYASAVSDIVEEVRAESADVESFTANILARLQESEQDENVLLFLSGNDSSEEKARFAQMLLAAAEIPSLLVKGVYLANNVARAPVRTLLAVYDGEDWLM